MQKHLKHVPTRLTVLAKQRALLENGNSVTKKSGTEQVECVMSGFKPEASYEPRERIDVDQIIANTQISTRHYGSDPIRTELNPVAVRSMLDDTQADLV